MDGGKLSCVVIFLLILLLEKSHAANKCFSCASRDLEFRWHLTGLPNRPGSGKYVLECQNPNTAVTDPEKKKELEVDCEGACISYMFQALNSDGVTTASSNMWVRGCHEQLADLGTDHRIKDKYCEVGSVLVSNAKGGFTKLEKGVEFCVGDECNKVEDFKTLSCGNGKPGTTPPTKCIQCGPSTSNCKSTNQAGATCENTRWCSKTSTRIGRVNEYLHACSPVNPFGGDVCRKFTTSSYMEPYMLDTDNTVCYCGQDECNGGVSTTGSVVAVLLSVMLALAIKY